MGYNLANLSAISRKAAFTVVRLGTVVRMVSKDWKLQWFLVQKEQDRVWLVTAQQSGQDETWKV